MSVLDTFNSFDSRYIMEVIFKQMHHSSRVLWFNSGEVEDVEERCSLEKGSKIANCDNGSSSS